MKVSTPQDWHLAVDKENAQDFIQSLEDSMPDAVKNGDKSISVIVRGWVDSDLTMVTDALKEIVENTYKEAGWGEVTFKEKNKTHKSYKERNRYMSDWDDFGEIETNYKAIEVTLYFNKDLNKLDKSKFFKQ